MTERLEELLRLMREAGIGSDSDSDNGSGSASSSGSSSPLRRSSSPSPPRKPKSFADLKQALNCFLEEPKRPFRVGDVVYWKEGCANRKRPKVDEPAVVLEVLPHPVYGDEKSAGTPYFHEPLDIVLGMLDSDGDLTRYCFDKRRFRLAIEPEELASQSPHGKLRKLALEYNEPVNFKVGDVVMLKKGLRHRANPDYNTMAVVTEILPQPFRDTTAEEGTSSFYELINGRIGMLDNDGDLMFLHVDLRRFRKVN